MITARFATAIATALISILILTTTLLAQATDTDRYWAQWRGPRHSGVSPTANPPLEWSETKNVRWKVEIPGRGFASPVVWGDRVFVLTAVPAGLSGDAQHAPRGAATPRGMHRFLVLALDRKTGKTIWEAAFPKHRMNYYASPLVAGDKLYAPREDGVVFVASIAGDKFEVLAENDMGESIIGSPVPLGNRLLIRGTNHLFCIAGE